MLHQVYKSQLVSTDVQVHGKRFAVLIRFVDELEASLNPDEMHDMDRSRASFTDQSDRDSSGRSVQD